jgi:hypothetical protein
MTLEDGGISPELHSALQLLNQYRHMKKLESTEFNLLRRATAIAIGAGGTVSLVRTEAGLEFRINTKPKTVPKPRRLKS